MKDDNLKYYFHEKVQIKEISNRDTGNDSCIITKNIWLIMCRIFSNSSNTINSDLESKSCTSLTILDIWEYLTVMIERINRLQNTHVYTEATRAFKNLLLISATRTPVFFKNKSLEIEHSIGFDCSYFFVWVQFGSTAELNQTQSNSIHGLGSIVFDWVRLKFSSIGFDLLSGCMRLLKISSRDRRSLHDGIWSPTRA